MINTLVTVSSAEAAAFIKQGRLVAFPTETVYGLGADVFNAEAIAGIFEAKMRPEDNPLIAHIAAISDVERLASHVTVAAMSFIDAFFPGPLTIVLPKKDDVPRIATAGLGTIGIRMPAAKLAREFLFQCETPVVAPSANLSGRPSPTTWEAVFEDLNGRIDCILRGDATEIGLESTVVDCTGDVPLLLREGGISLDELRSVVAETERYALRVGEAVRSPGLKHRHYSPRARVVLISRDEILNSAEARTDAAFIGMTKPYSSFARTVVCATVNDYAHEVFAFFRECDRAGIEKIFCEIVNESGIGAALMDRLRRAAE